MDPQPPTTPASPNGPPRVGDHALIRLVGRGSYGEVWLARSVTDTYRALKIVSRSAFADDRPFEREFAGIQKFEPISRTHPGFVSILHVGRNLEAGSFYYVMELADDLATGTTFNPATYQPRTLGALIKNHQALPVEDCLRIGISLSAALGHLHKHSLVHRDIKPSNIIFVSDIPKLADIGLVTGMGEKMTFVGTEGYLSPEGPGLPTADLYALGKVLYEISMGKDRLEFPELPANLRESQHAPLLLRFNEILLKACEPTPRNRFSSAEALRASLQALLRDCARDRTGVGLGRISPRPQGRPLQVVILHTPSVEADARLARFLEDRLAGVGHEVFVDEPTAPNLEWGRMIELQIRAADAVVVLFSTASVKEETIAYAVEIGRQTAQINQGQPRLVAVPLPDLGPLPRRLKVALGSSPLLPWNEPPDPTAWLEALGRMMFGPAQSPPK